MVDLSLVFGGIQTVAIVGGIVLALIELRQLREQRNTELETRQADILLRHSQMNSTREFMDAWHDVVFDQNYLTGEEWLAEYGPGINPDAYIKHTQLIHYYDALGGLLRGNLLSLDMVEKIWQPIHLVCVWERVEPVIKRWRKTYQDDSVYENLEYLINMMMERHPESSAIGSARREQMVRQNERELQGTNPSP